MTWWSQTGNGGRDIYGSILLQCWLARNAQKNSSKSDHGKGFVAMVARKKDALQMVEPQRLSNGIEQGNHVKSILLDTLRRSARGTRHLKASG